jgi:hypothetical protein
MLILKENAIGLLDQQALQYLKILEEPLLIHYLFMVEAA